MGDTKDLKSIIEKFHKMSEGGSDVMDKSLARTNEAAFAMLHNSTEYKKSELNAISILRLNPFLYKYVMYRRENKKYLKRKHTKEILKALKYNSQAVSGAYQHEKKMKLIKLLGNTKNKLW